MACHLFQEELGGEGLGLQDTCFVCNEPVSLHLLKIQGQYRGSVKLAEACKATEVQFRRLAEASESTVRACLAQAAACRDAEVRTRELAESRADLRMLDISDKYSAEGAEALNRAEEWRSQAAAALIDAEEYKAAQAKARADAEEYKMEMEKNHIIVDAATVPQPERVVTTRNVDQGPSQESHLVHRRSRDNEDADDRNVRARLAQQDEDSDAHVDCSILTDEDFDDYADYEYENMQRFLRITINVTECDYLREGTVWLTAEALAVHDSNQKGPLFEVHSTTASSCEP
jgi:hypothetical protein